MKFSFNTSMRPGQLPVLAVVLLSYLMIVLDISIVITGLPKIREGLDFSPTGLSWVQNGYTLAFGGLLMLGARAGDILGRRRLFVWGMGLFTLSSLAIGFAQTPTWLVAARVSQGVGAAVLAPATLALLSTHFSEGTERTRALACYAAVAGVGASLGLVLGGLFASTLSWRVGFFMNVPIGIALILAARRLLDETPRRPGHFDLVGALSSTLGMTFLVYGIEHAASAGWQSPWTITTLVTGVVLLVVFVRAEARVRQPILPLRLFASRERSGAYAARMLFIGAMVGFFFFTTQLLQDVFGYTPTRAGLAFLPLTIPTFVASLLVPALTRRIGNGGVLAAALGSAAIGMFWLGQVTAETPYLTGVAMPMLLIGMGNGAALGPLTMSGVTDVAAEDAGAASGLVSVAHQLGGSLGLAVLLVVFSSARVSPSVEEIGVLVLRIDAAFSAGALMLAFALLLALGLIVPSDRAVCRERVEVNGDNAIR